MWLNRWLISLYVYVNLRFFDRLHTYQFRIGDCGTACLSSICKVYKIKSGKKILRKLAGTTSKGTTLLGLRNALLSLGIDSDGYTGSLEELRKLKSPSILHVTRNHFVVCYGYDGVNFKIGNPSLFSGIKKMSPEELDTIWKTKRLLVISLDQINQ